MWILQRVNSSIWIAIKRYGSDMKWMNSLNDPEELVFKSTEASGGSENCYLLKVSNTTVYSNDETDPVIVVSRSCTGHRATDLALCMKRKCTFCFMKLMLEKFLVNESWRRLRIYFNAFSHAVCGFQDFHGFANGHAGQSFDERPICKKCMALWLEMQKNEGLFGLQLQSRDNGVWIA